MVATRVWEGRVWGDMIKGHTISVRRAKFKTSIAYTVIIVNHDILYLNAAKITDFKCTYTHRISV
jgi:hypothetical protein